MYTDSDFDQSAKDFQPKLLFRVFPYPIFSEMVAVMSYGIYSWILIWFYVKYLPELME